MSGMEGDISAQDSLVYAGGHQRQAKEKPLVQYLGAQSIWRPRPPWGWTAW